MRASIVLSLLLLGCSTSSSTPPDPQPLEPERSSAPVQVEQPASTEQEPIDPRFTDTLLKAAREYRAWGRVDEFPNLAPMLCRAPTGTDFGFPSHARLSGADEAQHGKKLL